jgi:hypothetical protein
MSCLKKAETGCVVVFLYALLSVQWRIQHSSYIFRLRNNTERFRDESAESCDVDRSRDNPKKCSPPDLMMLP